MVLRCDPTLFDMIFTGSLLYALFISDMVFTFVNLRNLKRLMPKKYLNYEKNFIIKKLIMSYGLTMAMITYPILGLILFTILFVWVPIHAGILVGFLIGLLFLVHIPNYFEIKKRLKKNADRLKQPYKRNKR